MLKKYEFMYNFQRTQFYELKLTHKHIIDEIMGENNKFTSNVFYNNSIIFSESSIASKKLNVL